jgi:hypothetical protein
MLRKSKTCITILWTKLCLLWALCACTLSSAAQARIDLDKLFLKKSSLSVAYGLSFPVLEFASASLGKQSAGYAQTGQSLRLCFSYETMPLLGIKLGYMQHTFPFHDDALLANYRILNQPATVNYVTVDDYYLQGLIIGFFVPLHYPRTTIELGVSGGFATANLPQLDFSVTSVTNTQQFLLPEATARDLVYMAGVRVKHQLIGNLLLTAEADFLYSEQTYTNLSLLVTPLRVQFLLPDYTQYYHAINVCAGLAVQF